MSHALDGERAQQLAADIVERVHRDVPGWTDSNSGDPGVTLLEVFAFVVESMLDRPGGIPPRTRRELLAGLARAAWKLEGGHGCDLPIRRVRYFAGQVLGAEDFLDEQTYFRDKIRRHNVHVHGAGIVHGLEVAATSTSLRVEPGYALDACGNELVLSMPKDLPLPGDGLDAYVVLQYAEHETAPVPGLSGDALQCSRVEECCEIVLEREPDERGLAVARLVNTGSGWGIDPAFVARRVRLPQR